MNVKRKLMIELKKIYDDKDFVCSTISIAKTEKAWRTILDYIHTAKEYGDDISSDNIQLIAIHLRDEEDKKQQAKTRRRIAAATL